MDIKISKEKMLEMAKKLAKMDFCPEQKVFYKNVLELMQADAEGRLLVLPCMVGDTVYVVGEHRVIKCDIDEVYLDDKKGLEYLVSFDCDSNCKGCPFDTWHKDCTGEYTCDGEYGQTYILGADVGKTIFLTREEAEAALEKMGGGEK